MSYILDALKRADAQRQAGAAPGLHLLQEPEPLGTLPADTPPSRTRWVAALGISALLISASAALWWWKRAEPERTSQIALSAPTSAPAVATQIKPGSGQIAVAPHVVRPVSAPPNGPVLAKSAFNPVAVASAAVRSPAKPASSPVLMPGPQSTPTPAAAPKSVHASMPGPAPTASMPAPAPTTSTPMPAPVSPVASSLAPAEAVTPDIPKLSELPDAMRRQLPALKVTGSVYSDNPSQRLLVINGQVLTQGNPVAAGLMLEEIGEKSSVLSFSGTRFKVPH